MAISYPVGPSSVPVELTQPPATYRRRVALAMGGVLLFLALYALLTGWLGWTTYRLISASLEGKQDTIWGFVVGAFAAFLTVFMVKGIFFMKPRRAEPLGLEVTPSDQPQLFDFLHQIADEAGAPRPHRVFLSPRVNASVSYDLSLLNLVFPSKKNLEIGLGLVNTLTLGELKAVLAHEFGHFTQRSMAVGRWVYTAQQIAARIVAKRDSLDRFLVQLSRFDIRIAWVGWILSIIIWSIRSLVDSLFSLALRMHRALSREMEFHADLVAVSLTGSDAPIYALHRLRTADDAWDRTMAFAVGELAQGRAIVDLFAVQSRMIDRMRDLLDAEWYRAAPSLPEVNPEALRVFEAELAEPPRMWSTHPPNDERETNAKRVYIPAPLDHRTGWLLFADAQTLREKTTALALGNHEKVTPMDTAAALTALDAQFGRESLAPRYRGIYLDRSIVRPATHPDDLYEASAENAPAHLSALYPESLAHDIERLRRIEHEKALLEAVRSGMLDAPGGIVRHRGRQVRPKALAPVIEQLEQERSSVQRTLWDHDRRCRTAHRAAAAQLGRGWEEYLRGLAAVLHYAEHNEANVRDAQRALQNCLAIATAGGRVGKADVANVVGASQDLYDALIPAFTHKRQVLLDRTLIERLGAESWASLLEAIKLGRPAEANIGAWLGVIDGWVMALLGPLGALRRAALDQLLVSEARVATWIHEGTAPETAPAPSKVPERYPVLLPGDERELVRALPWWKRFQTADGVVPATARFLVAASIIGAVLGFGGQMGSATVTIYNGLGRTVVVSAGPQQLRVAPFAAASLTAPPGPLQIRTTTVEGQPIDSMDANVSHGLGNFVYNVAGAGTLTEWTQSYGYAPAVPPNELGAQRWIETEATTLFTDPPERISTNGGGALVRVLSGRSGEHPGRVLGELRTEDARRTVILAHARWDAPGQPYTMHWLNLAESLPNFQQLLGARLAEDAGDMLALRERQDAVAGAARDSVCTGDQQRAAAAPNDGNLQYLATRCIPDADQRNRAFLALHQRLPDNAWVAFAAGYALIEQTRWEEALTSLETAKAEAALIGTAAPDLARVRRMVKGTDVDLRDLSRLSDEVRMRVSLETGEGLGTSPYQAYSDLKQGRLSQALARAGQTSVRARIWPLLAASDGANPTWADSAFAVQVVAPDSSVGIDTVWPLMALAERRQLDLAPYVRLAKKHAGAEVDFLLHFMDVLRTTRDPAAAEKSLGRVSPSGRGVAYSVGTVILGPSAPPAWREGAKRLLFASERPYFQ